MLSALLQRLPCQREIEKVPSSRISAILRSHLMLHTTASDIANPLFNRRITWGWGPAHCPVVSCALPLRLALASYAYYTAHGDRLLASNYLSNSHPQP